MWPDDLEAGVDGQGDLVVNRLTTAVWRESGFDLTGSGIGSSYAGRFCIGFPKCGRGLYVNVPNLLSHGQYGQLGSEGRVEG